MTFEELKNEFNKLREDINILKNKVLGSPIGTDIKGIVLKGGILDPLWGGTGLQQIPQLGQIPVGTGKGFTLNGADWVDYGGTSTIVGWSSFTASRKQIITRKVNKTVFVWFHLEGTSNSTSVTFTLPYTCIATSYGDFISFAFGYDNGVAGVNPAKITVSNGTANVSVVKDNSGTIWTNSGTKIVSGQFWYEAST